MPRSDWVSALSGRHDGRSLRGVSATLVIAQRDADASNMLGIVLKGAGRKEESLAAFRQTLAIRPDFPGALANVEAILAEMSERRG